MRRTLSIFLCALVALPAASAQNYGKHPFDFKTFNLGFLMGLTYNSYNLKEQVNVVENGVTLSSITLQNRPGLNLGMITNLNLSNRLSLRFIPTISLEQRDFLYRFQGVPEPEIRKIEAAYLDMPVMFQIKGPYYKRTRFYVLTGGKFAINLMSNERVQNDDKLLKIKREDFGLTFGFGVNLYGDRIKLSPEILYKVGLTNIYVPEATTHANAIERLSSQVIAINVNFE